MVALYPTNPMFEEKRLSMKLLLRNFLITLLAVVFYATGFVVPWVSDHNGTMSIALAQQTKKQQRQEQRRLERQRKQEQKKLRRQKRQGQKRLRQQKRRERRRQKRCKRNPRKCKPPTVSELPIQYMVLSGALVIALSGGTLYLIRKRKTKNSLEA